MVEPGPARARLLEAGAAQLLDDGLKVLARGLNVAEIAERAGVSQKTFFATFGDKGRYLEELLLSLTGTPHRAMTELARVVGESMIETKGDPRQAVRAVCRWDFQQVRHDPVSLMLLATHVLARDHPGAMKRLRGVYAHYDGIATDAYRPLLAHWGVALRSPFTMEMLAVTLTALIEGLTIRHRVDPAAVPEELFGDVVVALLGALLDIGQQHEHVDDVIAPLADQVMLGFTAAMPDVLPAHPRSALLAAARKEFAARGYFATTPAHIATRAGLSQAVVKQLFPRKSMIVLDALRGPYAELRSMVGDDIALGVEPVAALRRYLTRLAAFAIDHREFVEALLVVMIHDVAVSPDTAEDVERELDLPGLVVPVIESGRRAGVFAADLDPRELAAMLTHNVLLRCFTRRDDEPAAHAAAVEAAMLHGLIAR
ncbi:TetR/AcrR family transcriptional regulator [Actinokineospora sp. NBRC 105648]|uniref:TetR/AcrR family transcriptional regulator n=1 Tax=Actinokineospora sp. NBRC 105648 TaxID=3032206 RepID=UPI0024A3ADE3|nr:TetR/AcrR family transcriptional regulator [Actinokineospora sp. NBRC 105648]GLZ40466.1 hypothetical protein Acsp05_40900 [Actinokineospora sp. NBRC 105648]